MQLLSIMYAKILTLHRYYIYQTKKRNCHNVIVAINNMVIDLVCIYYEMNKLANWGKMKKCDGQTDSDKSQETIIINQFWV